MAPSSGMFTLHSNRKLDRYVYKKKTESKPKNSNNFYEMKASGF